MLVDAPLRLRRPAFVFAPLGALITYVIALMFAAWASAGFRALDPLAAHGLATPAALGLLLAALSIGPRLKRGAIATRRAFIARAAAAFAAAGFAWPLSFGIAVLVQGDQHTALTSLAIAVQGLIVGALSGALGAGAASTACCQRENNNAVRP